ncbi:WD40 domain containing protein [Caulobacteraceae bacterium]
MSTQPPETHERAIAAERSLMLATHARWARVEGRHAQAMRFALAGWWVTTKAGAACAPEVEAELAAAASASAWVADLVGHTGTIYSAHFSPDGSRIVTASEDCSARIWDANTGQQILKFLGHGAPVVGAMFSSDGTRVLTWSHDQTARVWEAECGIELCLLRGAGGSFKRASFSPDGAQVLTLSYKFAQLWDVETGTQIHEFEETDAWRNAACFSPDGSTIAVALNDNSIKLFDTKSGIEKVVLLGHEKTIYELTFSSDGLIIVSVSEDGTARIWDSLNGDSIFIFNEGPCSVTSARFRSLYGCPTYSVYTFNSDGRGHDWNPVDRKSLHLGWRSSHTGKTSHGGNISCAFISPDGRWVGSISDKFDVKLTDIDLYEEKNKYKTDFSLFEIDFISTYIMCNSRGDLFLTLLSNYVLESNIQKPPQIWRMPAKPDFFAPVWGAKAGQEVHMFREGQYGDDNKGFDLSPDGLTLLVSSTHSAKHFHTNDGSELQDIHLVDGGRVARFSRDGSKILVVVSELESDDGSDWMWDVEGRFARLIDVATGLDLLEFVGHEGKITFACFSADDAWIVTASEDHTARIWATDTGLPVHVLCGHQSEVRQAHFSPDGLRVLTLSADGEVRLWCSSTGLETIAPIRHEKSITSALFSPDGSAILTTSEDATARIWGTSTGEELSLLEGHLEGVVCAAFSQDGATVVTGSSDCTARTWDVRTGQEISIFRSRLDQRSSVLVAAFNKDCSRIVTGHEDGAVRIWDTATGIEIQLLSGHEGAVHEARFGPDGSTVVTFSSDSTVRIWDVRFSAALKGQALVEAVCAEKLKGRGAFSERDLEDALLRDIPQDPLAACLSLLDPRNA